MAPTGLHTHHHGVPKERHVVVVDCGGWEARKGGRKKGGQEGRTSWC